MVTVTTKSKSYKTKYVITGILFLLPATVLYLVFTLFPFLSSLTLSVSKWNGMGAREFYGIANYLKAFKDSIFLMSMKNSLYIGFLSGFISIVVGIFLAFMLLYVRRREGGLYRTILFTPGMIPPVITSLLFTFVFSYEFGILNNILGSIGLESLQTAWLTNKKTVLNCIVFVLSWKQFGLTMVLCFAALQGIPDSLVESARLDGASDFGIFRRILLPLIRPVIELSAMFAIMRGLQSYDTVVAMTGGGPGRISSVAPMLIVETSFALNEFGYASSMSMIFVVLILLAILSLKRIFRGETYEY